MDIRDLIKRLDDINEEQDLTDFDTLRSLSNQGQLPSTINLDDADLEPEVATTMQTTNDRVIFNKKQEHLYSLLKQLRDIVNRSQYKESKISINKQLVESFGYTQLTEQDQVLSEVQQLHEAFNIVDLISKIGFIGTGIVAPSKGFAARITAIGDKQRAGQYTQDQAEKLATEEVLNYAGIIATNLAGAQFADFISGFSKVPGLPWWLKAIAGITGPALKTFGPMLTEKSSPLGKWLAGFIVSRFLSPENQKLIGSTILGAQDMLKSIASDIETFDPASAIPALPSISTTSEPDTSTQAGKERSPNYDEEVERIQKALVAKGAKITVDGILGPETYKAFDQYGDSLEEAVSLAESIKSLQDRLALIENPIAEEFSIEAGKKKLAAKYPDLAKRLGIMAPASEPVTTTTGNSAKPVSQPNAPVSRPTAQPQQPTTGVGVAPFAQLDAKSRLDAMAIVKQIQAAIRDISNVPPSMQGDARKAINHAQQTIQTYAPGMV